MILLIVFFKLLLQNDKQHIHCTLSSSFECRSGELTLRTTQFLEELRKNPTLKVMRDELASLLQDHLEKIGIRPVSDVHVTGVNVSVPTARAVGDFL